MTVTASGDRDERKLAEILLFTLFSIRHMVNDKGIPGRFTAHMLAQTSESMSGTMESYGWGKCQLVQHPGATAEKGFHSYSTLNSESCHLNMTHRGFGVLGKGLAYFSPHAVQLLLMHLIHARSTDHEYLHSLSACADNAGAMFTVGQLSASNQLDMGYFIFKTICLDKASLASAQELFAITSRMEPSQHEIGPLLRAWDKVARNAPLPDEHAADLNFISAQCGRCRGVTTVATAPGSIHICASCGTKNRIPS